MYWASGAGDSGPPSDVKWMLANPSSRPVVDVTLLVIAEDGALYHQLEQVTGSDSGKQYELLWCRSVKEAITCARTSTFDLIILARDLCTASNKDYLALAQRNRLPIPIVVVGKVISCDDEQLLIDSGASDYLAQEHLNLYNLKRSLRYARDLKQREEAITKLKEYCNQTGLPNRQLFYRRVLLRLQQAKASQQQVGLLLINIDGFKQVNNALGHDVGDVTMDEVVERLQSTLQSGQQLARLSEDQFAITLISRDAPLDTKQLITRISSCHSRPYRRHGRSVILGSSIGCSVYPDTGPDLEALLCQAGVAMHLAKKERGCSFRVYAPGLDDEASNQIALEPDLMTAIRGEQFELHYQPRIDLKTHQIVGAEALIRWNHPRRGLLYPGEFIPLAEKTGLVVPMGYWVVHQAAEDMKRLRHQGLSLQKVGVNLSFRQFQDEMLLPTLKRLMESHQVDAGQIEFELTETAMALNEHHIAHCIHELSRLGVAFSLDDFGTGFSSFAHLQKLPISTLKVDRSFVQGVTDNPDDAEIVRAIINLAHNLRKDVIAEGAETPEQIAFLRENGCDQVQGYYFSPPVSFATLCQQIRQGGVFEAGE